MAVTLLSVVLLAFIAFCQAAGDHPQEDEAATTIKELTTQLQNVIQRVEKQDVLISQLIDQVKSSVQLTDNQVKSSVQLADIIESEVATNIVAYDVQIGLFTGSPSAHTKIPFNVINLNQGNAYNVDQFVAPVSGLYAISFGVLGDSSCGTDEYMCVSMYVDGGVLSSACVGDNRSGGIALTAELTGGNAVWVSILSWSTCLTLESGSSYNKFSGHLIYQLI